MTMTSLMNARFFVADHAPDNDLEDRLHRLVFTSDEQRITALAFLCGFEPETFDAVMDAAEPDPGELARTVEPEPRCARCRATIGIFVSHGLAYQHYRGDGVTVGGQEIFFPGHEPVPYAEPIAYPDHFVRTSVG
jgi:hypothetical protein